MSNTTGTIFRLTTFGESHGPAIGGVLDGCPAGLNVDINQIQLWLDRRRPGQSEITSPRKEMDRIEILSGIHNNITLGTPIGFIIRNQDARPADYSHIETNYRPSHADFTWDQKFGIRDHQGSGRASARETVSRVAGGAIALQLLSHYGISVHSCVTAAGQVQVESDQHLSDDDLFKDDLRCCDKDSSILMKNYIEQVRSAGDTCGGVISCIIKNVPAGIGEPVFSKLHAELGKAMLGINAVKGFELGSGFNAASMRGSEHNDPFVLKNGKVTTTTNNSGGIQGGISNGNDITFKVAFKPVSTLFQDQTSINNKGETITVAGKGRHDACVVPRAVSIVTCMAALVLADQLLLNRTSRL